MLLMKRALLALPLLLGSARLGSSSSSSSSSSRTNAEVAAITKRWVDRVVIGKRLCPWARQVYESDDKMRISVLPQYSFQDWSSADARRSARLTAEVLNEAKALAHPLLSGHTTLLILPNFAPDSFEDYLSLSEGVDMALVEARLHRDIQLATFHPLYRFAGSSKTDPANYTNRAPFPVLHLLRVDDVSAAIALYGAARAGSGSGSGPGAGAGAGVGAGGGAPTDEIFRSNVRTMTALGLPGVRRLLQSVFEEDEGASAVNAGD